MLKKNEPDWIKHDGSAVCPVPAGHDVERKYWPDDHDPSRSNKPEMANWVYITHYRDWTAFEQQQASAGDVPEWKFANAVWDALKADVNDLRKQQRIVKAHREALAATEPKGEVPKLLTPEQAARISELREPELILGALTLAGLIAPEPEPVDPLVEALEDLDDAKAREAKLRACLGFFASVIKSGEPWTATCEQRYRAALSEQQP